MRLSSFSKKRQVNRAFNPADFKPSLSQLPPLSLHLPTFNRKLTFDHSVSDTSTANTTYIAESTFLNMKLRFPTDDDLFKHCDQETEESNSCVRSVVSDGKLSCHQDFMELENMGHDFFLGLPEVPEDFDFSRSPSPKKKVKSQQYSSGKFFSKELMSTPSKDSTIGTKQKVSRVAQSDYLEAKTRRRTEEASRLSSDFDVLETIGNGSFGTVYRCLNRLDKNEYAVKETKREFVGRHKASGLNEIQALASLTAWEDNTNVVRYYNSWIEDMKLYLVMEYCPLSLSQQKQLKGSFSEAELKTILRDICLGLSYLHRNDIVHLDVKPENILISKAGKYKLGDMGQSAIAKQSSEDVEEGDARYLAPELLNMNEYGQSDLKKADVFSLGITLLEIATGTTTPMNGDEWHNLRNGRIDALNNNFYLSNSFKDLIKLMLRRDPRERPSIDELLKKFLPDQAKLELKWERAEGKLLRGSEKDLREQLSALSKRRKSL